MTNQPPARGGPPHPEIRVAQYEDWMAPQVIALLAREWKQPLDAETRRFHKFFDHPFQRQRAVRLVALDDEIVCGFLSFVYWPYEWAGETLHAFQGGDVIVSPEYRGQGVMLRLGAVPWHVTHSPEVSFLTGFPAPASFGVAIRSQWVNPVNLSWYVRVLHPLSALRVAKAQPVPSLFETQPEVIDACRPPGVFSLSRDPAFVAWRAAYSPHPYWYFHFRDRGRTIRYQLKANRRGRVSEVIIGDVARESLDADLLTASLQALIRAAKQAPSLTILSIAINERCADTSLRASLAACGFHSIRRHTFFCVRPLSHQAAVAEAENWFLLRSDIDTW